MFYTVLEVHQSDALVKWLTALQPDLDQIWLAAPFFKSYWDRIKATSSHYRFMKIGFEYIAAFDNAGDQMQLQASEDDAIFSDDDSDEFEEVERRTSKLVLQDRLSAVDRVLSFRDSYGPFNSMVQMRVPAAARGGHDIYFNGKTTNRSASFVDHRQTVSFVAQTYQRITEDIESRLWSSDLAESTSIFGDTVLGAPFSLKFKQRLQPATFDNLIDSLRRKTNRFRLAGFYNRLSATKVQVNGIDRHLWQPLWLEVTDKHIVGILPTQTCGNIVNRLITNVQRLVDPEVEAWVGSEKYSSMVGQAFGK